MCLYTQIKGKRKGYFTCPNTVQGLESGTSLLRMNSASFTMLSARKCVKYLDNSSADLNWDIEDGVRGVDKPVPRCDSNISEEDEIEYDKYNSRNLWGTWSIRITRYSSQALFIQPEASASRMHSKPGPPCKYSKKGSCSSSFPTAKYSIHRQY